MWAQLISTLTPLLLLIMSQDCINTMLLEFNILDLPCLKMIISKSLGYAIVGGSMMVKFPQILKIQSSGSVVGLSLITFLLETFCCCVNVAYNYKLEFPFSTWGESFFIALQLIIMLAQFFHYTDRTTFALLTPFLVPGLCFGMTHLTKDILALLLTSSIPLMALSKIFQIKSNFMNGHTGQLSFATSLLNFLGCLARLFTVIQEVEDSLILLNIGTVFALNTIIVLQFVMYWNAVVPKAEKVE